MAILSYAQNFEDVMLWRAFKDISDGFWIDVGAADPDLCSVTSAFSDHGWRGINIEPTPAFFTRIVSARSRDINLNVALGAAPGRMTFYECADAMLSTLDPAIAERNRADGRTVTELTIDVMTLADLCREHAPRDIHFLKIDVEGSEAEVLAGADFATFRPWILVIEATRPLTQVDASAAWEPALLAAGYRFAWFDGVNRFYIAREHWDALSVHFHAPPNIFDQFIPYDPGDRVKAELTLAQAQLALLRAENAALRTERAPLGMLRRVVRVLRRQLRP